MITAAPPQAPALPDRSPTLTVSQALDLVLSGARTLQPEHVTLLEASGRTLAHDLSAALTNPPFDSSSMDGYAVRSGCIATTPATLKVIGESAAGWPFAGTVKTGEAVRIFTGAPLPDGADTVVIQENTTALDGAVRIEETAKKGLNVRWRGHDFHEGDKVLSAGTRLEPRHVLLAATAGHASLAVIRKPKVAILATGDELVEPTDLPRAGQIVSSNTYGLSAMVAAAGGHPMPLGIARDTAEDLVQKFAEARGADILVTMGGASVGDHDLVRPVLESQGARLDFYKIAMRPGKPVFCGELNGTRVLGLPGNPLSVMIGARVFLLPLIARLLGGSGVIETSTARLATSIPANGPRAHYMRARLDGPIEARTVRPLDGQDSAFVKALSEANCIAIIPANSPALAQGTPVQYFPLDF